MDEKNGGLLGVSRSWSEKGQKRGTDKVMRTTRISGQDGLHRSGQEVDTLSLSEFSAKRQNLAAWTSTDPAPPCCKAHTWQEAGPWFSAAVELLLSFSTKAAEAPSALTYLTCHTPVVLSSSLPEF